MRLMGNEDEQSSLADEFFAAGKALLERRERESKRRHAARIVREWLTNLSSDHRIEKATEQEIGTIAQQVLTGLENGDIFFIVNDHASTQLSKREFKIKSPIMKGPENDLTAVKFHDWTTFFVGLGLQVSPGITTEDTRNEEALRQLVELHRSHTQTPVGPFTSIDTTDMQQNTIVIGRINAYARLQPKDPSIGTFPYETEENPSA